jgi:hypothetical protein
LTWFLAVTIQIAPKDCFQQYAQTFERPPFVGSLSVHWHYTTRQAAPGGPRKAQDGPSAYAG